MTYQLTTGGALLRSLDGAVVPADPSNRDYQDYIAWVARGNIPDPAVATQVSPVITAGDFLDRFTTGEQAAIWSAASTHPAIGVGLTLGLANGVIDVSSPVLVTWLTAIVTAGALSSDRIPALTALPT